MKNWRFYQIFHKDTKDSIKFFPDNRSFMTNKIVYGQPQITPQ